MATNVFPGKFHAFFLKNCSENLIDINISIASSFSFFSLPLFVLILLLSCPMQGPFPSLSVLHSILVPTKIEYLFSYKQQAEFSLAYWPFSVKLLWAPIVDSCFIKSFGRRKSWLVPVQYLIGRIHNYSIYFYFKYNIWPFFVII